MIFKALAGSSKKRSYREFSYQYDALRAAQFLLKEVPSVDRERVLGHLADAVDYRDLTDLIVQELRQQKYWQSAEHVVGLYDRPSYEERRTRQAIICYALECPHESAARFIASLRKRDPAAIDEARKTLP